MSPLYGSLTGLPPTYVYSGSLELLAPDVLRLSQQAATQGAPISFVLRSGEIHDWALGGLGDSMAYRPQIYGNSVSKRAILFICNVFEQSDHCRNGRY